MKRWMKGTAALVLVMALFLALVTPALAAWGTMYTNKSKVKVYRKDSTDSKVIKTLKGGKKVVVDAVSPNGKWAQITVDDTKSGGQRLGFIRMKDLSKTIPQSLCSHEWGKWKVESEATCTQPGYRYRICKVCGLRDEGEIKKLAHSWGKWKVTKEATCTREGERTRTCRNCGKKETEKYLADHSYGGWTVKREATCAEEGQRVHTCKVCGHQEKQAIAKRPHDYTWEILTEATDHSAGVREQVCVNCGYTRSEESFDPEGTIRRSDRGEAVYNLQTLLAEQGYLYAGGADGIFGGGTEKALMQFQKDRGLSPDGVAWPQTIKLLNHDFGPWETVVEMTRAQAGERVRVCRDCGYEQHETIEPGTVFERGRRGEDIRSLQQMVKDLGYDAGGFDGIYGKNWTPPWQGLPRKTS